MAELPACFAISFPGIHYSVHIYPCILLHPSFPPGHATKHSAPSTSESSPPTPVRPFVSRGVTGFECFSHAKPKAEAAQIRPSQSIEARQECQSFLIGRSVAAGKSLICAIIHGATPCHNCPAPLEELTDRLEL